MIGHIFAGRYRVISEIARGGMGAVYRAEQISTGRLRALKILYDDFSEDLSFRAQFEFEAHVGSLIPSPHVVEVIDAGFDDASKKLWMAMELLQGRQLDGALEGRLPLTPTAAWVLLTHLGHALCAAHAAKEPILHLDLKPENLFLTDPEGQSVPSMLKVLDFGIARAIRGGNTATRLTRARGTPLWMAPEQTERDGKVRPATDVWALGLLAFWMLTGKLYWPEGNARRFKMQRVYYEILQGPLDPPSVRAREFGVLHPLPTGFDGWFLTCVAREPGRRFPNATAAFNALERVLAPTLGVSATASFDGVPAAPLEFRRATDAPIGAVATLPSNDATVVADAATLDVKGRPPAFVADDRGDESTEATQWAQRGELSMRLKKWPEAVEDFSEAIVRAPMQGAYWYGRALAFKALGQEAPMRVDLTQAGLLGHAGARELLRRRDRPA